MKKILSLLICAVLCVTLFTACGNKNNAEDEIYIPIRQGNHVNYDTAHAYKGTILEEVYLEGTFSTPYSVNLAFTMTDGVVEQFNVRVDQEVKKVILLQPSVMMLLKKRLLFKSSSLTLQRPPMRPSWI